MCRSILGALAAWCAACSLAYPDLKIANDGGSSGSTDGAGTTVLVHGPNAQVACGKESCSGSLVCCVKSETDKACASQESCTGAPMACDGIEDCGESDVCCGWLVDKKSYSSCTTRAECENFDDYRFLCDPTQPITKSCSSLGFTECKGTSIIPGTSKCTK